MRLLLISVAVLAVSACGGSAGGQIASACKQSEDNGEMSDAACDCLAERARAELTPEQQSTLLEIIEGEVEEGNPSEEQFELAFFVAGAALECQAAK